MFCEIFGPVLTAAFLLLLLGGSVDTSEYDLNLHTRSEPNTKEIELAHDTLVACINGDGDPCNDHAVMGDEVINRDTGSTFNASTNSIQLFYRTDKHDGLDQERTIQFVPSENTPSLTNSIHDLSSYFRLNYPILSNIIRTDFKDESSLEEGILKGDSQSSKVFVAIVLEEASPNWRYKIRGVTDFGLNMSNTLLTGDDLVSQKELFDATAFQVLLQRGHHFLQFGVDAYILNHELAGGSGGGGVGVTRSLYLQPFPTPWFRMSTTKDGAGANITLCFALVFLIPVMKLVNDLVEEKEKRVKGQNTPEQRMQCARQHI